MMQFERILKEIEKSVDNFHFPNHTDRECHEKCDPKKSPYLRGVNTEVCEQLFNVINKFRNCKKMNEGNFFLFFLFLFDLHNLKIEGRLRSTAHPKSEQRYSQRLNLNEINEIAASLNTIEISEKDIIPCTLAEECSEERDVSSTADQSSGVADEKVTDEKPFSCDFCSMRYKRKNGLTAHMKSKHGQKISCDLCSEIFDENAPFQKHFKSVHECKYCGNPFSDLSSHEVIHLTCTKCEKTFDKMWKLTKHLKTHNP